MPGEFPTLFLYGMIPTACIIAFAWGLERNERKRRARRDRIR